MIRYTIIVLILGVVFSARMGNSQDEIEVPAEFGMGPGVCVTLITNAEINAVRTKLMIADLTNSRLLSDKLNELAIVSKDSGFRVTLTIGNSTCNLRLIDFVEYISKIENLSVLILDSVDIDETSMKTIRERHPNASVILSEKSAIQGIWDSIRHDTLGFPFVGDMPLTTSDFLHGVNGSHLKTYTTFVGPNVTYPQMARITPGALHYFRHLRHLMEIRLEDVGVQDCDLRHLANCSELKILYVDNSLIDGSGLRHLSSRLTELYASGTPNLTSIPFEHFPELTKIRISDSRISEEEFLRMKACKNLSHIDAHDTKLTAKLVLDLVDELPRLKHVAVSNNLSPDPNHILELRRKWKGDVNFDGQTLILEEGPTSDDSSKD